MSLSRLRLQGFSGAYGMSPIQRQSTYNNPPKKLLECGSQTEICLEVLNMKQGKVSETNDDEIVTSVMTD